VPQLGVHPATTEPIADVPPYVHAVAVSAVVVLMEVPPAENLFASDLAILPEPVAEGLATDK
jgi:phosphotransacetylase